MMMKNVASQNNLALFCTTSNEIIWPNLAAKFYFFFILGLCKFLKFMFSKKAIKIDEIFTVDLTLTT